MGLFQKLLKKEKQIQPLQQVSDEDIVAMASGMVVDVTTLPDPLFAESLMGETIAFSYTEDKITLYVISSDLPPITREFLLASYHEAQQRFLQFLSSVIHQLLHEQR